MKHLAVYLIALSSLLSANFAFAQFNVSITVNDGTSTTTCTDNFSAPDPMWSININNEGWVNYPFNGLCYTDFPNLQFEQNYLCLPEIPQDIQVCFRAFENDPSLLDLCTAIPDCLEEICIDVPVPPFGSVDFPIALPPGLSSGGQANLTIAVSGIPGGVNDLPCQAVNLGVLANGTSIGLLDTSIANNYCATNFNEPDPITYGNYFFNQQGVWFKFTTNSDPQTLVKIEARSDPSNFGDPINLELAVFSAMQNDCNSGYSIFYNLTDYSSFDETIYLRCPQPDRDYYILVDGRGTTPEEVEGYFGLLVTEMDIEQAPNFRCDALALGAVPEGGSVATPAPVNNGCANGVGDPQTTAFGVQVGTWFTFVAPPTGHVNIEGVSDTLDDPIGIQLALFASSNDACNGQFSEVSSIYDDTSLDQSLEVSCLDPGRIYYILIDGALNDLNQGTFEVIVTDAGNETPVTNQDITICFGDELPVGPFLHGESGVFEDTLQLASGCDSIVITTLTVLEDIEPNLSFPTIGLNMGNMDGSAAVAPTGGAGGYSVLWSDGQTTFTATNLTGGDNYCVEVTDALGCVADTCFEMPFYVNFIPTFTVDTLACFGDSDATISFTAQFGIAPYVFSWDAVSGSLSGAGQISFDGQMIVLENLPADVYSIQISDVNYDTTLMVEVIQPDQLSIGNEVLGNATCFGVCDGTIDLTVNGGTPPYTLAWSNSGAGGSLTNLCAGTYEVTVTDDNGCTAIFDYEITEPAEFIATAEQAQAVSCFAGNDGVATVSTNGTPSTFIWSNGGQMDSIANLPGGIYEVTVTNSDGCTATASVEVDTPEEPVSIAISEIEAVLCFGGNTGELQAVVSGPGNDFDYSWNNGDDTSTSQNLPTGSYSVTVSNELGCSAEASYLLSEPTEITLDFSTNSLTCNDPANGGIITVDTIVGGEGPYLFSSNTNIWNTTEEITGYMAGQNVFYVQDAIGCVREFEATIDGPQEIFLNLEEDFTVDLGEVAQLNSQSNIQDLIYAWSPAESLDCPDCPDVNALPLKSTTYRLTVTDEYDCTASAEIFVNVIKKRKVYVPNAFSPNGDGMNDIFTPFLGPDVAQVDDFKVFDRQGNLVFESDGFFPGDLSKGWDGIFRGKIMQPGVFVWFAQVTFIDGEEEIFEGDVTLVR